MGRPSHNAPFDKDKLEKLFNEDQSILCGDFNARSPLWGSSNKDARSRILESILEDSDKVVLNTGAPTRIYTGGESHIDLAFASPSLASVTEWEVLDTTCGSDHNLIQMKVACSVNYDDMSVPKWIYRKANWNKFSLVADRFLNEVDFDNDVEVISNDISNALFLAAKDSIPMSKGGGVKKHNRFWNKDCEEAVKVRNRAKSKLNRSFDMASLIDYKRSKAVATKVIKKAKRSKWRSFCATLSERTKLGKVWKVIKGMNNVGKSQGIPHLHTENGITKDNLEKANLLAKHFAKVSSTDNYTDKFKQHKVNFENEHNEEFQFKENDDGVWNVSFKIQEFTRALKKCKNTSPGQDMLSYEMFRHLSLESKYIILSFYNLVWSKGVIPKSWRHAIIVPILKPNKDKT